MKRKICATVVAILSVFCFCFAFGCGNNQGDTEKSYYTVTFDANGGSFDGETEKTVIVLKVDPKLNRITDPVMEGKDFDCWEKDGEQYDFSLTVTSDFTLKARYKTAVKTLNLTETAGVSYVGAKDGDKYEYGKTVSFTLDIGALYAGEPAVFANGEKLSLSDGVYSVVMDKDVTVTVAGVKKAVSDMQGAGTVASPYLVEQPADLIFIAQMVNSGNVSYVRACYKLTRDIDLKGESLQVIGDGSQISGSSAGAYFSGYFEGDGYAIRNFRIETENVPYVGLFGRMIAGVSDDYTATVSNLTLENFYISASVENDLLACGSFVGYGIGANVFACSAIGGEIELFASDSYFAYAGGIFGVQQSAYSEDYDLRCFSSVTYCASDVSVSASAGLVLCAGGITGYLVANEPQTTAFIVNSYSTGSVTGAIRAGGIVGSMGGYTSVADSYATGDVNAQTNITDSLLYGEYVYSFAGGLVGFAENDCIVSDSFATGTVSSVASLGGEYGKRGDIYGGGYVNGYPFAANREISLYNAVYILGGKNGAADLTDADYLKTQFGFKDEDWVFSDGNYPVINYEEVSSSYSLKVTFVGGTVQGEENGVFDLSEEFSSYMPIVAAFIADIVPEYFVADGGYRSFGLFFDEELKNPVPDAFILAKNVTLYCGFADYSQVSGVYYVLTGSNRIAQTLELKENGVYTFTRGGAEYSSRYVFDGTRVLFKDGNFAQLSDADGDYDKSGKYDFVAIPSDGELLIFDGNFFTQDNPLTAGNKIGFYGEYFTTENGRKVTYSFRNNFTGIKTDGGVQTAFTYTVQGETLTITAENGDVTVGVYSDGDVTLNGNALSRFDDFKGVWESGFFNKEIYEFDGVGGWTYEKYDYTRTEVIENGKKILKATRYVVTAENGTYTVRDGVATLSGGNKVKGTVCFNEDGFLELSDKTVKTLYGEKSYYGVWFDTEMKTYLYLFGLDGNGVGRAYAEYENGESYSLTYTYEDEGAAYMEGFVNLYSGANLFGFFYYAESADMLYASLYWSESGYMVDDFNMSLIDDYQGEWISDESGFETVRFNGLGLYDIDFTYQSGKKWIVQGYVTVGGEDVRYYLAPQGDYDGYFIYNGVKYYLALDPVTETVTLSVGDAEFTAERRDEFYEMPLIDKDGTVYSFDGRGNLLSGGTVTFGENSLSYALTDGGMDLFDGENKVGVISLDETGLFYVLSLYGENDRILTLYNEFSGIWAVSGSLSLIEVGVMFNDYTMDGRFDGEEIKIDYLGTGIARFTYSGKSLYLLALTTGDAAISGYPSLDFGDYVIISRADDYYGVWKCGDKTLSLDGLGNCKVTYGYAFMAEGDKTDVYLYSISEEGDLLIWNSKRVNGKAETYLLVSCDINESGAFVKGREALRMVAIDELFRLTASSENGETYYFDGFGKATRSDGAEFAYGIVKVNQAANTADITLTAEDGTEYTAVVDFSDRENVTITVS